MATQNEESGLDKLKDKLSHELNALTGDEGKNKLFSAEASFASAEEATREFEHAKKRLFAVKEWSDISALSSTFTLHDASGKPAPDRLPAEGDYLKIELPATKTENWVQVQKVNTGPDFAEFTVRPSQDPNTPETETKHFFSSDATSTFRVERNGKTIQAFEIGLNEYINNQGREAGERAALNTLIAEGGWAIFQKVQWQNLTDYLVGKK